MEVLNTDFLGKKLQLDVTLAGWQRLFWDGTLVSERVAGHPSEGEFAHSFTVIATDQVTHSCVLRFSLEWEPFRFRYALIFDDETTAQGERDLAALERVTPVREQPPEHKVGSVGLLSLLFKLMKSAKAIKAMLALGTLGAYSWLFSLSFALALIFCLVIHEYGHLRAMRYFGMKTKGIYLIPFLGGLAVTEDRVNTRWQAVFIAMMGPFFGAMLSLAALVIYLFSGAEFFAGLAAFNALLNLFNLLPILPLDGGHVLKSVAFSMNSAVGVVMCVLGALLGVILSYSLGLSLLGFLLMVGTLEIFMEWRLRHVSSLLPMGARARTFSTVWYVMTVTVLVGVMLYCGSTGNEALQAPLTILQG